MPCSVRSTCSPAGPPALPPDARSVRLGAQRADGSGPRVRARSLPRTCHTVEVTQGNDLDAQRADWQRRQQRTRRLRDFGLLLLTLGVLVLVYVALLASG